MIDQQFVNRCNEMFKEEGKENYEKRRKYLEDWNRNNNQKLKDCQKKYYDSEKGKNACRRRGAIYHRRIRELSKLLDHQEKEAIRLFYVNCPPEYEVDHIIPISKGGKHHITNLQYLPWRDNRKKKDKLDWKPEPQT